MFSVTGVFSAFVLCVSASILFRVTITSLEHWPIQGTEFHKRPFTDQAINNLYSNLFWFMQISDIHLSEYRDLKRGPDLKSFINKNVAILRPEVVIMSGDITDGRQEQYFNSGQLQSEWDVYQRIISETHVTDWTVWLDSRGNHDTFDVPSLNTSQNYFTSHGVQGKQDQVGYIFKLKKPYGQYSFVSVDLCPRTGIKFPLNFFGEVTSEHERRLTSLATSSADSSQTFWFGHYPTSTVIPSKADFRSILGESAFAYFSGHLHTVFGLVPRMYALQPQGFLELELGDWRDNRIFRIVAVDHDLVSFADYKYHSASDPSQTEWPIVLITNPKDATFLLPHKEPIHRLANSTHIRILAWSPWPITSVSVELDGVHAGLASPAVSDIGKQDIPLYVLSWQPSRYSTEQSHWITVTVQDANGNQRIVAQPFVVDDRPLWKFPFLARLILHGNFPQLLAIIYYLMSSMIVFCLLLPRCLPRRFRIYLMRKRFLKGWCRLGTSADLYVPILLYILYSMTCPLYLGFLLTNHIGIVFSFGIFVAGSLVLESLSYLYEITQLSLFWLTVLPGLSLYLGYYDRPKHRASCGPENINREEPPYRSTSSPNRKPLRNCFRSITAALASFPWPLLLTACCFTVAQAVFIVLSVAIPYGWLAGLLSPGRLGLIPFSWFLLRRAATKS